MAISLKKYRPLLTPFNIAGLYAVAATAWLTFTNRLLAGLAADPVQALRLQTYNGWLFILLTAVLLYFFIRRNAAFVRRSTQALRDSEQRLRAILDSSTSMVIYLKDVQGRYQLVNRQFENLFRVSAAQVAGRTDHDLLPRPIAAAIRKSEQQVIDARTPMEFEEVITHSDGVHTYLSVKFPFCDGEGIPYAVCSIAADITERKRMEEALRESEDRFRDVTEAASDWIWETDGQFRFTYLSERFFGLTGISPEQVLGRTRWALAATDADQEKWRQHQQALEQHLAFRDFVYQPDATDSHGRARYFKISGKPVFDAQGRFRGYRGTGTDITEQMRAEAALRESQRALATLMSNLPGMAYRCRNDEFWTMEFVSSGAVALTGYQPEDLVHNRSVAFSALIHPDDRDKVRSRVQAAVAEQCAYRVTYRIRTRSDEEKWVLEHGCGVFDAEGRLQSLEGLIMDITERKRAEEERSRMRLYLKNIIDSMPSVLLGVDSEGRIIEWNQHAEKVSGVTREDAQGRFFLDVLPQLEIQLEQVRQAIQRRESIKSQRVAVELDGEIHYTDVMVYPLVANGGIGAVIRVDDVTNRVRIEEMMVQTEKMLSVGGLAAGMAHEINNPLGTILQGCQNVLRRISPNLDKNRQVAAELGLDMDTLYRYLEERDVLRFLEGIREAGTRAAKIVADMLAFSRRSDSRFSAVDLGELLDTVVRLAASDYDLKKRYDFKQIDIQRDYDPELGGVSCDKLEIEQVILNLIKNAAQAMAEANTPQPMIRLITRREPGFARIEIIDNGPGMAEKIRRRVFEPFFTTKEVGVGTGLGLSVSYFIVTEQHKGTLAVSSAPGQGARFIIRLPLART